MIFLFNEYNNSNSKKIEDDKADVVYGNGLFVDFNNTDKVIRKWVSGTYEKKKMRRGWLPLHPTVYIRREKFSRLGLYDESFKIAADSDFWYDIYMRGI